MAEFREITNAQGLEEILIDSSRRKIIIFKHSTTCPISSKAWREVQDFIRDSQDEVLVAMIKVIESRPISNQVAEDLGVIHQSPQAMLINNRQVIWHVSHQALTKANLKKAVDC